MKKRIDILATIALVLTFVVLPSTFAEIIVTDQSPATVRVKCGQGFSINQALEKHPNAQSLIIEIEGMCDENVIVRRDRVTLRGANAANDGIRAVLNTEQSDAALWVRGAHLVRVENLKLTGGFVGLLATEASTPFLTMSNCRLEGNVRGTVLESSLLQAADTVFTSNSFNAMAFLGSRLECNRCTFSNPGGGPAGTQKTNLLLGTSSSAVVFDSAFSDGGINNNNSTALITDSTIDAFAPNPAVFGNQGIFNLTRVQVGGSLRFFQSSNARLFGVTQTRNDLGNIVDEASFVNIGDASPATGGPPSIPSTILGFNFRNFSNGVLLQTSQVNGNLTCGPGGNAFCANVANVSGTSNCALCPKP